MEPNEEFGGVAELRVGGLVSPREFSRRCGPF
jgi:hypothetical protein